MFSNLTLKDPNSCCSELFFFTALLLLSRKELSLNVYKFKKHARHSTSRRVRLLTHKRSNGSELRTNAKTHHRGAFTEMKAPIPSCLADFYSDSKQRNSIDLLH